MKDFAKLKFVQLIMHQDFVIFQSIMHVQFTS